MIQHLQRARKAAWCGEYLKWICGFGNTDEPMGVDDAALLSQQSTKTKLQLAMQLAPSGNGIKYHVTKLRTSGMIRHVSPTKSEHREVLK